MDAVTVDLPHLYVFNMKGGGYVIASGDERALPVLGYSATGSFDWDRVPENMRAWLHDYGQAIEALGDMQLTNTTTRRAAHTKINPLVKTQWSQNPVYNAQCPTYNGQVAKYQNQLCVTGCTATAMAQVMNYYQWPQGTTTQIPAYFYTVSNVQQDLKETFSAEALPTVTFDWSNMRNRYLDDYDRPLSDITEAQAKAVATLMRYCGQAIHMIYSPYISLANNISACEALRQYFNYDNTVRHVQRNGYTIDQWEELMYNELANNRPVMYSGTSDDGGHAFICDGYDGNGLFHINWGWEGYNDNYFSLSVLNPNATNVAGVAKPGIGFCMYQNAVIGIQPNKTGSATTATYPKLANGAHFIVLEGADKEDTPGYNLVMTYQFDSALYPEAEFELGLFYKENDTWKCDTEQSEKVKVKNEGDGYYSFFYYKNVNPSLVPDGTTRLYPRYRCTSVQGAEWQLLASENYYFEYTVQNGNVTITAMPSASALKVTNCTITSGTGTAAAKSNLTLTIENSGAADYEGTLLLSPISIGNEAPATAEGIYKNLKANDKLPAGYSEEDPVMSAAFLKAGAKGEVTFSFTPRNEGNYLLLLYEITGHDDIKVNHFAYTSVNIKQATGISDTTVKTAADDGTLYDLQGRRASNPKQGLYIKNGRKHVIK
ncbi:MAG: C10 family peptidase [Prevotella sp.]|nr:C10 family peptidase [Prevotella sp.]